MKGRNSFGLSCQESTRFISFRGLYYTSKNATLVLSPHPRAPQQGYYAGTTIDPSTAALAASRAGAGEAGRDGGGVTQPPGLGRRPRL